MGDRCVKKVVLAYLALAFLADLLFDKKVEYECAQYKDSDPQKQKPENCRNCKLFVGLEKNSYHIAYSIQYGIKDDVEQGDHAKPDNDLASEFCQAALILHNGIRDPLSS